MAQDPIVKVEEISTDHNLATATASSSSTGSAPATTKAPGENNKNDKKPEAKSTQSNTSRDGGSGAYFYDYMTGLVRYYSYPFDECENCGEGFQLDELLYHYSGWGPICDDCYDDPLLDYCNYKIENRYRYHHSKSH